MQLAGDGAALLFLRLHQAGGKFLQLALGQGCLAVAQIGVPRQVHYVASGCGRQQRAESQSDGQHQAQPVAETVEDLFQPLVAGGEFLLPMEDGVEQSPIVGNAGLERLKGLFFSGIQRPRVASQRRIHLAAHLLQAGAVGLRARGIPFQ